MSFPDCPARHVLTEGTVQTVCRHPHVHSLDQRVTPEICGACDYRTLPLPFQLRPLASFRPSYWRPKSVAVVIPCHNYGRFLGEAIESALTQTRRPQEILVVDDASTDDTREVAASFRNRGVQYIRVDHRHSQRTRQSGYEHTASDVLCFLDADDCLAPDYLELGLAAFENSRVGIVYSDMDRFGAAHGKTDFPVVFDRQVLARMNFLHSGSLVLREALRVTNALAISSDDRYVLQDWLLWRRILDQGWTARKQSALYRYRRHDASMTADWMPWNLGNPDYFQRAGLAHETITLAIPLSGRTHLWPGMAEFLERQTWPHGQIRLVLLDTSQDPKFAALVRTWLAQCDYSDVRYLCEAVGAPGLADRPRPMAMTEVTLAMARIYNRLLRDVGTDYVWIIEDDVVPPLDACVRLLHGFDAETGSVSGTYWSRCSEAYVVWQRDQRLIPRKGTGLEVVGGNGFGCVLLRSDVVRQSVFTATIDIPAFDNAFYYRLPQTGLKAKVDWTVECAHHTANVSGEHP